MNLFSKRYFKHASSVITWLCVLVCTCTLSSCENRNSGPLASLFFGEVNDGGLALGKHIKYVRSEIVSDVNRDRKANPGETIYLLVYLKNSGTEQLQSVRLTISTSDFRISSLTPQGNIYLGTVDSGTEVPAKYDQLSGYGSYSIQFKIAANAVRGSSIQFDVGVQDAASSSWAFNFPLLIE